MEMIRCEEERNLCFLYNVAMFIIPMLLHIRPHEKTDIH